MSQTQTYDIDLSIKYDHQQVIDVPAIVAETKPWANRTLTKVNDSVVRLGIIEGDFHWHKHENDDEFFYVVEGRLFIDVEGPDGEFTLSGAGRAGDDDKGLPQDDTLHRTLVACVRSSS